MSEEFIKEAKNFRRQMKWCSIICWVATLVFVFMSTPKGDYDWIIIPFGGIVFTLCYFSMNKNITEYEKLKK
ncbi:MAG: hypothetical protein ACOVOV_17760 [Dolichospermum sp.]